MARLDEVKSWMRWWGWSETDGAMLKRDFHGVVIAHRGDAVWEADIDKAIALEDKFAEQRRVEELARYISNRANGYSSNTPEKT